MKRAYLCLLITGACLAQTPPIRITGVTPPPKPVTALTNELVIEMVQARVPASLILARIQDSDPQFRVEPVDLIVLTKAGVSEEIVQAMNRRMAGPARSADPPVAVANPTPAIPPYSSPEPPVGRYVTPVSEASDDDGNLDLGRVELGIGGGISAGSDRPGRAVAPTLAAGVGVGLHRNIALIGNYSYQMAGPEQFINCALGRCTFTAIDINFHEFTGGVRASIPNSTRFTPWFSGSAGMLRATAGTRVFGVGVSASESVFVGGGGFGFDIKLARNIGIQYDIRAFVGQYGLFYGRTAVGLYVRMP